MTLIISCETGGETLPGWLVDSSLVADVDGMTESNADATAKYVAGRMAERLDVELIENVYSNALIDVTKSLHHRDLFPGAIRGWPTDVRQRLIEEIYLPYRQRVRRAIKLRLSQYPYVVHVSLRTFGLKHRGTLRRADAGLLYDPSNNDEVDFCLDWIDQMYDDLPMLRVRRNYPRRGTVDSVNKAMRQQFAGEDYLGVEMMLNRAWVGRPVAIRDEVIDGICESLKIMTRPVHAEAA